MGEELPRGWNFMSGAEYASAWNYVNKAGQAVVTFTRPTESPPDWDDSLEQAAERGDAAETKAFLSSGGDPNAVKQPGGWPLISVVAKNGHTEALEALVEGGADLNARELGGHTALAFSAKEGHVGPVRVLIGAGADVDLPNRNGCTPLHLAADCASRLPSFCALECLTRRHVFASLWYR